jgi:hypothetical protein
MDGVINPKALLIVIDLKSHPSHTVPSDNTVTKTVNKGTAHAYNKHNPANTGPCEVHEIYVPKHDQTVLDLHWHERERGTQCAERRTSHAACSTSYFSPAPMNQTSRQTIGSYSILDSSIRYVPQSKIRSQRRTSCKVHREDANKTLRRHELFMAQGHEGNFGRSLRLALKRYSSDGGRQIKSPSDLPD